MKAINLIKTVKIGLCGSPHMKMEVFVDDIVKWIITKAIPGLRWEPWSSGYGIRLMFQRL